MKVVVLVLGLLSSLELHYQDWEVEEGVQLVTIQRMLSFFCPLTKASHPHLKSGDSVTIGTFSSTDLALFLEYILSYRDT